MARNKKKFDAQISHFPLLQIHFRGPVTVIMLIHMAHTVAEFYDLIEKYFSNRNIQRICERSKTQSKSNFWYLYRRGVVTATLCRRIINQNLKNEANHKINKAILKPWRSTFTNEAMTYGLENEEHGVRIFFKKFKKMHQNAQLHEHGVVLHNTLPYIGASPDAVLSCDCCKKKTYLEVKSPLRLRETGVKNWRILEYLDDNQNLKKSHPHYNQINLGSGILNCDVAYFVVYAKNEIIANRVDFDSEFFEMQVRQVRHYYEKFFLPNVLGKKL